jgi:predicted metal-dependent HD superfamily phosphohydrolase
MLRGVNGTVLADVPRTIRREQGLGEVRACLVGESRVSGRDGVEQQALRDGYGHRVDDAALLHCWRAAAPPGSDALARELLDRWREPHRHYHTLAHLAAMLAIVGQWPVVELAVWFHDAVYDPRATDNEEASAELAERSLPAVGAAPATVAEVARLVRLTATHDSAPGDGAGALLCDADLSILAADPARYDAYAAAVRREYGHVPDEVFRIGRAEVLRHLLGLPVLYRVVPERAQWEVRARANLTRELSALA